MKITDSIKIIKKIVATPSKADEHDPLMVATTYAGQCLTVNERLKHCADLIRNNMAAEALEEAGHDPHLIDLCNEMTAPTLTEWRSLCKEKGWPISEELNMSAFNEIMQSFKMESSIEPLLKQLRRANNQGYVGQCVAILREIVKKDPHNPEWKSNLTEFETTYLDQIKKDIEEFRQEKNINGVARLIVELKQPWTLPVESTLIEEMEKFIEAQYKENLHKEEEEVVSKIGISFQSGNVEALGEAIAAYNEIEKKKYFQPDASLRIIYINALNWYQQQLKAIEVKRNYESKLEQINNKIEHDSYKGIKELWEELKRFPFPVPEDIIPDVEKLLHKEAKAKKQQQRKKQMGYILIILFAMVCIFFAATWNYYRQIKNRLTTTLDDAVAAENLERCYVVINDMTGRKIAFIETPLFSNSEIGEQHDKAKALYSLLEEKKVMFQLLIGELEEIKSQGFPNTIEATEKKIGQILAVSNVATPPNLARMKFVQSAWEERKGVIRAMEEKELSTLFEKIASLFKNIIPAETQEDIDFDQKTLQQIQAIIVEGMKLTSVSTAMKKNLSNLKNQMDSTGETISIRKNQLIEIMKSDSLDKYIRALQTFLGTFPDDIASKKIKTIIESANIYKYLITVPLLAQETDNADNLLNNSDNSPNNSDNSSNNSDNSSNNSDNSSNNSDNSPKSNDLNGLTPDNPEDSNNLNNLNNPYALNDPDNPFWFKTAEIIKAFNNNIKIHKNEVQDELKKMERTSRFVDLWKCTVHRPNFEPETWYFNGKPTEEFVKGIKSYAGIVYILSPDDLQPEFKANSAITVQVLDLKKMDHCDVVQQMLNNISYDIGMESIMHEIKNIYHQNFSPILKLHLISFLVDQLFILMGKENALPFIEMAKDFKRFNNQVNWLCTANKKYSFESGQAQAILRHHLERPDRMNDHVAQWKIRKTAIKRAPRWVGFTDLKDPAKLHFKSGIIPNEIWVVRNSGKNSTSGDKPVILVTEEQRMGSRIKYSDHNGYLPGEPLFAPYDNNTTTEVLQSIMADINSNRKFNIEWPSSWPVNLYQ